MKYFVKELTRNNCEEIVKEKVVKEEVYEKPFWASG